MLVKYRVWLNYWFFRVRVICSFFHFCFKIIFLNTSILVVDLRYISKVINFSVINNSNTARCLAIESNGHIQNSPRVSLVMSRCGAGNKVAGGFAQ